LHAREKDRQRKKYQVGHIFSALLPNAVSKFVEGNEEKEQVSGGNNNTNYNPFVN